MFLLFSVCVCHSCQLYWYLGTLQLFFKGASTYGRHDPCWEEVVSHFVPDKYFFQSRSAVWSYFFAVDCADDFSWVTDLWWMSRCCTLRCVCTFSTFASAVRILCVWMSVSQNLHISSTRNIGLCLMLCHCHFRICSVQGTNHPKVCILLSERRIESFLSLPGLGQPRARTSASLSHPSSLWLVSTFVGRILGFVRFVDATFLFLNLLLFRMCLCRSAFCGS